MADVQGKRRSSRGSHALCKIMSFEAKVSGPKGRILASVWGRETG